MTYKEIKTMISGIGLPYTYDSFPNNIAPEPPYIVFHYPEDNDFAADNINYVSIDQLSIELYTSTKDFDTESQVESVLTQNGLYFSRSEAYIRNEDLFQIKYDLQVVTEGEQ